MTMPRAADAPKYYRVATQRLADAELILKVLDRPSAAMYLAGYAVECILKALMLALTPPRRQSAVLKSLKTDFGHNLGRLRAAVIQRGGNPPQNVGRELLFVSSWSPELRYEPGPGDAKEAERFIAAVRSIVEWADRRM
jgi:HEPN domain-containing protein